MKLGCGGFCLSALTSFIFQYIIEFMLILILSYCYDILKYAFSTYVSNEIKKYDS